MINVYSIACNRPDFIDMQYRSLKRNLIGDFRYTIFNNSVINKNLSDGCTIDEVCACLDILSIDIKYDRDLAAHCQALEDQVDRQGAANLPLFKSDGSYSNSNIACAYSLCWAWKHFISKSNNPILLMDSDIFLIKPFDPREKLDWYTLSFVPVYRPQITYMWNALVLADIPHLPHPEEIDWYCGQVNGHSVDVGGQTHYYLEKYYQLLVSSIDSQRIDDEQETGYELLWDKKFLHYLRGSNWNNQTAAFHKEKTEQLKRIYGL